MPWMLNMSVALLSMQGQKAVEFHQKYLNLCSEDEQRSWHDMTWHDDMRVSNYWHIFFIFGWTIPLKCNHIYHCLVNFFERNPVVSIANSMRSYILCERFHNKFNLDLPCWTTENSLIKWESIVNFTWGLKICPCRFISGFNLDMQISSVTSRKLPGLQVTSAWALFYVLWILKNVVISFGSRLSKWEPI